MAAYNLDADETVILREIGVSTGTARKVTLILTNKNIIQINRDVWGKDKDSIKYPLSNLKVSKGKANVLINKNRMGKKQLELFFVDCEKNFQFNKAFAENTWAREIIKAQKNRMAEISKETNSGKKSIIQSIKETIGTAKDSLLIERRSSLKKICKCPKCGAELVGGKGEKVKCDYCDTFVVIK